ncbi:spore protein SP21 [bacterium BMS3Abin09]|nr:spore protein SP21 [bacterium BMS3Abin09]GBE40557.1 spore protein SP21 [bacterium BMS3Bbin09]
MLWNNNSNWFWDPWDEFDRMRQSLSRDSFRHSSGFPAINTWVSSDDSVVTTEIPGVDPANIDISVVGRTVTLRGSRRADELQEDESYHRRERWSGEFSKAIELPFNIEADKVTAKFNNGVLYLTLPKAEAEKPRKIEIKSS